MNGSWDAHLASPTDFAGVDNIITNLAKEREPGNALPNLRLLFTTILNMICFWCKTEAAGDQEDGGVPG